MTNKNSEIWAFDFDGTLANTDWPKIISPKLDIINKAIKLKEEGNIIILWTCREGKDLEDAIRFCNSFGLFFNCVNSNYPSAIVDWNNNCRKIFADHYVDDKAINVDNL